LISLFRIALVVDFRDVGAVRDDCQSSQIRSAFSCTTDAPASISGPTEVDGGDDSPTSGAMSAGRAPAAKLGS